ncbi:MAG TPA: hypothetical protein VF509_03760 [Sphingobium sp.]
MTQYRFVTPDRSGKWYNSIEAAQKAAGKIGAGFRDDRSGQFYPYPHTALESRAHESCATKVGQTMGKAGQAVRGMLMLPAPAPERLSLAAD